MYPELTYFKRVRFYHLISMVFYTFTCTFLGAWMGWPAVGIYLGFTMPIPLYFAYQVDRCYQVYDLKTYKERTAFLQGTPLEQIERNLTIDRRFRWQKPLYSLLLLGSALLACLSIWTYWKG